MIVCCKCNQQMRPKQNGVYFIEVLENGITPYKLWSGDLVECQNCGTEIITGIAMHPIAESWQDDFSQKIESFKPSFQAKQWTR